VSLLSAHPLKPVRRSLGLLAVAMPYNRTAVSSAR
jgi:hypothetical protein